MTSLENAGRSGMSAFAITSARRARSHASTRHARHRRALSCPPPKNLPFQTSSQMRGLDPATTRRAPRPDIAPLAPPPIPASNRVGRFPIASCLVGHCRHRAGSPRKAAWPRGSARRHRPRPVRTLGWSRQPPNNSAIGPLAQRTTAGTNSATTNCASAPNAPSAARRVKPMPSPPIRTRGFRRPFSFSAARVASAASDANSREVISSATPSLMEYWCPLRISRSSPPRGKEVRSSSIQGIMEGSENEFDKALARSRERARLARPR